MHTGNKKKLAMALLLCTSLMSHHQGFTANLQNNDSTLQEEDKAHENQKPSLVKRYWKAAVAVTSAAFLASFGYRRYYPAQPPKKPQRRSDRNNQPIRRSHSASSFFSAPVDNNNDDNKDDGLGVNPNNHRTVRRSNSVLSLFPVPRNLPSGDVCDNQSNGFLRQMGQSSGVPSSMGLSDRMVPANESKGEYKEEFKVPLMRQPVWADINQRNDNKTVTINHPKLHKNVTLHYQGGGGYCNSRWISEILSGSSEPYQEIYTSSYNPTVPGGSIFRVEFNYQGIVSKLDPEAEDENDSEPHFLDPEQEER